jgi:protein arginine N-methyltransferase 5
VLSRWGSEPVYQIYLPATSFISNAKGYPVLTKSTQSFLRESFKQTPTLLLARTRSGVHESGGNLAYAQYIRHLERTSPAVIAAQQPGTLENFAKGYWDYLQAPLQVMAHDLVLTLTEMCFSLSWITWVAVPMRPLSVILSNTSVTKRYVLPLLLAKPS